MKKYILLLLFLALAPTTQAQLADLKFEQISTKRGLSQSTITCMLQDRHGFIWFGTADGLNRYDGYTFKIYRNDPENANSLSGNVLTVLYEDRAGNLWMGTTNSGLNRFDPRSGTFTRYLHRKDDSTSLSNDYVSAICEDREGKLWIGSGTGGLNRLDTKTGKFTRYRHQPNNPASMSSDHVVKLYEDRAGTLWIGTSRNGLNQLNPKTGTFTRYGNSPNASDGLKNNSAWVIYEDGKENLWVGGIGGTMHRFDRKTGRFTRFENRIESTNASDDFHVVISLCEDRSGMFWMAGLNNGLTRFDPRTGQYAHYETTPNQPNGLHDNTVTSVLTDHSGLVWVGTYSGGVHKMDGLQSRFTHYQKGPNALNSTSVSALVASRSGAVWVGTVDGGVNKLNLKTGKVTWYQHQANQSNSLSSNSISCLHEDKKGILWVGTYASGLNRLDPATGKITRYPDATNEPKQNSGNIIIDAYEDRPGALWVVSAAGLSKLEPATGRFTYYKDPEGLVTIDGKTETGSVLEDRKGVLWVGGDAGLATFDRAKGQFIPYQSQKNASVDASVTNLFEDKTGTLWIATTEGVYRLDTKRQLLTHYGLANGLADELVLGVLEDDKGLIWISTNKGIARFNPKTATFRNFDGEDGFQSTEFNAASVQLATGELVCGGGNGLDVFDPAALRDNPHVPPVLLTDFQVFNQSVPLQSELDSSGRSSGKAVFTLPTAIHALPEVTLPYQKNVFSFSFAALDYTRPEKNQYAYQMEGFDQEWVTAGTRRFVTYTNLSPGTYTFRVKGSNNDGVWNEKGQSIRVTILPPPWRTWWAYLCYALAGMGALYLFRRYTISRERLKADLQLKSAESQKFQEIDKVKTHFFTNLSHEFRTPLTLILGPLEQKLASMANHHPDATDFKLMHRNARRLLELINQLLDLSKIEAGHLPLQTQYDDIVPLVRTSVGAFETLAHQRQIELLFNAQPTEIALYFDRDKLEKVVNNLVSNAFKFTPNGGAISVRVALRTEGIPLKNKLQSAGCVLIEVEDSGNGIAPDQINKIFDRFYQVGAFSSNEQEGSGIGLALSRELVHLHEGEITVSSVVGEGSRFTIKLPLGKAHLTSEQIIEKTPSSARALATSERLATEVAAVMDVETQPKPLNEDLPLVLLVEDNADMRTYLKSSLGNAYRIVEATDGEMGWQQALQVIPDLIISDVMMPEKDGFQLCEQVKTDERTSHIPVILLTARAGRESKLSGLETGADDYLTKPFDAEELRVRAKNLITQRQKLRERFKEEIVLPTEAALPSAEEDFLKRAMEVVEENLTKSGFDAIAFSREMGMSQSQLYRKLMALTGHNLSEFIRRLRLQRAAQLLATGAGNVTEVCYEVGFSNLSYFAKCFRELYGQTPSEFASGTLKVE